MKPFQPNKSELSTAYAVARQIAKRWSLVEEEDLNSVLVLWLYENAKYVERYRADTEGPIKLFIALRRRANQHAVAEQATRAGMPLDFNSRYSIQQVERSIVAMFNEPSVSGNRVHPASGSLLDANDLYVENKKTMVLEVKEAFLKLDADTQRILMLKYEKEYTFRDIALVENMSAPGIRKRIRKALRKIQSVLDGQDDF